jgi:hypothetical protein
MRTKVKPCHGRVCHALEELFNPLGRCRTTVAFPADPPRGVPGLGSCLANEWPTNDQWHDRRTWRSCHLPGTSLSGWPDLNRRPLRPEYSLLILPHSQHQDEVTDAETIRGVREHASHRLCLAVLLAGPAPQRSARSRVHSDPHHGILKYRRQPVRGAQGRLVTANLNDKPVTNDQGPDRCGQRSGP